MPTESYILDHDLWQAFEAICLSQGSIDDLKTLAHYDVDATEDDAEDRVIEIINDECAHEQADSRRKVAA